MEVKKDILWRVYLSFIGIVVLSFVVLGKAFYIQRAEGKYWRCMSDSLHQRIIPLDADRGTIYSEDGQMLSTSLPTFDIYMDFGAEGLRDKNGKRFRENIDSFAVCISKLFGDKSANTYKNELKLAYRNKDRYFLLKKKLSFEQYKQFREFPLARLGRNKSGVITEIKSIRKNPYGLLANRTIGLSREYVASNGKLKSLNVGLENTYDSLLRGQTGSRLVRFIAGGAAVPVEGYEIEPENGKDIVTTIDVNIQDIAETALMKMMLQSESEHGTCIVMETRTGKIKAIANLGRRPDGGYWEDDNYALITTEPGSTIKLATLLAVLSEGKVKVDDKVEVGTSGSGYVGVRNVNDAERSPKSVMSVRECFAHSSNVGMSKLAFETFSTQPSKFLDYLHKFRLDTFSGIDLKEKDRPRIPRIKKNNEGLHAMVTMSFGYALEVSPLQTLMLYNAIANEGKMMKPYLVNSIQDNGLVVRNFEPEILTDEIAEESVIKAARQCMEAVATEGTAMHVFKDVPFKVAGKTGTAHVAGGPIKYTDGVYQASFAGYFPADRPEYSCIVVIKTKPHAALHYGGQLAAPVFKEVAVKLFALYVNDRSANYASMKVDSTLYRYEGSTNDMRTVLNGLNLKYTEANRNTGWGILSAGQQQTSIEGYAIDMKTMPDVKGLGLKDALYLLENLGIKVEVKGKGKVIAQSVEAGTGISKGMKVVVLLG